MKIRFWVLVLIVAVVGVSAVGLSRISWNVDITRLLPENSKEAQGWRYFLKNFSPPEELIVTVEGKGASVISVATEEMAEALRERPNLVERVVSKSPWEDDPSKMTQLAAWSILNQSPEELEALEARLVSGKIESHLSGMLEKLATSFDGKEGLLGYDPLGMAGPLMTQAQEAQRGQRSEFSNSEGTFRVMYVRNAAPSASYRDVAAWIGKVREIISPLAEKHGVTIGLTGEPGFVADISTGMETDMKMSGITTLILTGLIVWAAWRTFRFMPMLVFCLSLVFVLTLGISGFVVPSLTVLTVGFASILIGLSADYGVLTWQASLTPHATKESVRREVLPGIVWAAATTAASFLALLWCGMPGLAELGLLVAIGVVIGGIVMIGLLPEVIFWFRRRGHVPPAPKPWLRSGFWGSPVAFLALIICLGGVAGLLVKGVPEVNADSGSMRPKHSEAFSALERLQANLGGSEDMLSVLVSGPDEETVAQRLLAARVALEKEEAGGKISSFMLPTALWPDPEALRVNLEGAGRRLVQEAPRLKKAVLEAGFAPEAFGFAERIFDQWKAWDAGNGAPVVPDDEVSQWILRRLVKIHPVGSPAALAQPEARCSALGMAVPTSVEVLDQLQSVTTTGVYLAGTRYMNRVMDHLLRDGFQWLGWAFAGITFFLLVFALRGWRPLLLTVVAIALSFGALLGSMSWLGLQWNAFTLPALLLSLGTGSDYYIHVMLDLEKHGSLTQMRVRLGQALVVCAATSIVGFGSLVQAGTQGLASLGTVCALALLYNLLSALFVMPWIWNVWRKANAS